MEMQWEVLIPNLDDPKRFALVKDYIALMSSVPSSRCVSALKVGLKKAFELKRRRAPPDVGLQCSNSNCSRRLRHLSYSSIGTTSCQSCAAKGLWNRYYQCTGCGYIRMGEFSSCQGCGGKFV
jgi:hypothetical protein